MTPLHFMTIAEASSRIRNREVSPVEIAQAYFALIKALDGQLNAFLLPLEDQATRIRPGGRRQLKEKAR